MFFKRKFFLMYFQKCDVDDVRDALASLEPQASP